jgi:hypothetical protein
MTKYGVYLDGATGATGEAGREHEPRRESAAQILIRHAA